MKNLTVREAIDWLDENVGDDLTILFENDYDGKNTKLNMRDKKFKNFVNEISVCTCDAVGYIKAHRFNKEDILNGKSNPSVVSRKVWTINYTLVVVDDFE